MGAMIGYALAALFAAVAVLFLMLFVTADAIRTKEYIQAERTMAKVKGRAGESRTSNYGLLQTAAKYYSYNVTFVVQGQTYSGRYLSKKNCLNTGDDVEVRYVISRDGAAEIVNRNIKDRFLRFLLCAGIGVFTSLLYIIFIL
jgi:hypothetical protein